MQYRTYPQYPMMSIMVGHAFFELYHVVNKIFLFRFNRQAK